MITFFYYFFKGVIILNSVDFILFWNDVVSNGNCVVLVESRKGYVTFDFVDGL